MGWTPDTFWKSSLIEYFAAVEGWNDLQQGKTGKPKPLLRDEYEELKAWDAERLKRMKARQNGKQ